MSSGALLPGNPEQINGGGGGGGISFDPGTNIGDILKKTGASTVGTVTAIPESLIVSSEVLTTFTNDAGTQLKGATLNAFNLDWTYNRNSDDPTSQTINHGVGAVVVTARTKALVAQAVTSNTTYTISAIGDDGTPSSLGTNIVFENLRYYGVDSAILTTDAAIIAALSNEFETSIAVTKTFDASGGGGNNHLYIAWEKSFGLPTTVTLGGFDYSDYTIITIAGFTNTAGFSEDYYVLRTNNTYNGPGLTLAIT